MKLYLCDIFKSNYCKFLFFIFLIIGYLIVPKKAMHDWHILLVIMFTITFAAAMTCMSRIIKEKVVQAKHYGSSMLSVIGTLIGVTAMQFCGASGAVCTASVSLGIVSAIFPNFAFRFFEEYSTVLIIFSILMQIASLYLMNCFRKVI